MTIHAGIDEAGYGPLLGPLVVGASVWTVDAEGAVDLWRSLRAAVRKSPRGADPRLPVCDSKALHAPKAGIGPLERSVLAFAQVAGLDATRIDRFIAGLTGSSAAVDAELPWYRDLSAPLPRDPRRGASAAAAENLTAAMQCGGVRCDRLLAQIVSEGAFNARVGNTHNKASVLIEHVLRIIQRIAHSSAGRPLHITVDRLGGREHYRDLLMQSWPERTLHEIAVDPTCSTYRLDGPADSWTIEFRVDADADCLPVALASMTAKYVRELLMERFNDWWLARCPAVRPTAGYYTDAQRFLGEIEAVRAQTGLPVERFVRSR